MWSEGEHLLALAVDLLAQGNWLTAIAASDKKGARALQRRPPTPVQRPGAPGPTRIRRGAPLSRVAVEQLGGTYEGSGDDAE